MTTYSCYDSHTKGLFGYIFRALGVNFKKTKGLVTD